MSHATSIQAAMGRYFGLAGSDRRLLERLERRPRRAAKGESLWSAHAVLGELYILQSGWACTIRDTCEGERQVIELLLPGDILGLREFTFRRHVTDAYMISPGIVCPFPHEDIVDLVAASTPLTIALFAAIGRQEALLSERMLVTLHHTARAQIAHFVIETFIRLAKLQPVDPAEMPFPISQRLLGQILGLSPVHINRTLRALERDGIMKKHKAFIVIQDEARLREMADFDGEYLSDQMDGLRTRLAALDVRGVTGA
ncbi:Crp/Fnr family transcriptional regulator [Halomonas sp. M4R1S46]|uniref:Crp/Fnr family transcriptional regulator n=1 Tax=Halomonas sp. M4R1S46 TaxID=2982692 RepID=UPI0021E3F73E|nr:Crp/Fnr family transcriptional regulator [Halomonas sp. M4R1S46]UYG09523.1 Crp/Fnr family transcriptional regulator [Halomonas sp. M4R1S46]